MHISGLATSPLFESWASSMLAATVAGGLFVVAVWVVCRIGTRIPAAVKAWLWWLACAKLIIGVCWTTPISLPLLAPPGGPSDVGAVHRTTPKSPSMIGHVEASLPGSEKESGTPNQTVHQANDRLAASQDWQWLPAILFGAWSGALLVGLGVTAYQVFALRRFVSRARPVDDARLQEMVEEVAWSVGLRRAPRLLASAAATDPLAFGMRRPTILLSEADLRTLSPTELRLVLAHELAHIRRGDLHLGIVPLASQILFFFFPLAWLASREFEVAREAACDAMALQITGAPLDRYGKLLVKLGARNGLFGMFDSMGPAGALGVSSEFHILKRRIVMLQDARRGLRRRALAGFGLVILVGTVSLIPWKLVAASPDVTARGRKPDDGQGVDWASASIKPVNLGFAGGLEGWKLIEVGDNANGVETLPEVKSFKAGVDSSGRSGSPAALLESTIPAPRTAGMLHQMVRADSLRGKRIRISAWIKTEGPHSGATLWIRQDTPKWQKAWNGLDHVTRGTRDWAEFAYVLQVAPDALGLDFGFDSTGGGKAWLSDVKITEVGARVPESKPDFDSSEGDLSEAPVNLDFKQGLEHWNWSTHDGEESYFAAGMDPEIKHGGKSVPFLMTTVNKRGIYGVYTQWFSAARYHGRRVRLSGWIKTAGIREFGGLMVGTNRSNDELFYDNSKRQVKGNIDWHREAIVLDVAASADNFVIGMNLQGPGKVWMDGLKFEVVGRDVPVTAPSKTYKKEPERSTMQPEPRNLSFTSGMDGWSKSANGDNGAQNPYYSVGVDSEVKHDGKPAGFLMSTVAAPEGYGALRQDIQPSLFAGKRVRLSAWIRTAGVQDYAGLLLSLAGSQGGRTWAMSKTPIKGTTDWKRYEIVADVKPADQIMMIGASIRGRGKVWATDYKIEAVASNVPVTESESQ